MSFLSAVTDGEINIRKRRLGAVLFIFSNKNEIIQWLWRHSLPTHFQSTLPLCEKVYYLLFHRKLFGALLSRIGSVEMLICGDGHRRLQCGKVCQCGVLSHLMRQLRDCPNCTAMQMSAPWLASRARRTMASAIADHLFAADQCVG